MYNNNTLETVFDIHIYLNGYFTVHLNKFSSILQLIQQNKSTMLTCSESRSSVFTITASGKYIDFLTV